MLTRRQFLFGTAALLLAGDTAWRRAMSCTFAYITNADTDAAGVSATLTANTITVSENGVVVEQGTRPAAAYNALWTRDHAYVLWHYPSLFTAAQRQQFITHRLASRTTGTEPDPDGGTLPANWIADRITATGVRAYKNAGASKLPFMDGIAFVVLALWADWKATGDASTFAANQSAIDACLGVLPRSASGCVYSDPAAPSVDYGFTDTVKKTGDVAYGTALLAWSYKMLADIAGENGTGTYSDLRAQAQVGLATLRKPGGWYAGSSLNNAAVDDVWATALIAAEGLAPDADCIASGSTIAAAYQNGTMGSLGYSSTLTQFGLVRHLPVGQTWAGTTTTAGTYQNGGYWLTPIWDCVRAVELVNPKLARSWATEAMKQLLDEHNAERTWLSVPYEWHNYGVGVGAKGYTPHAAIVQRFL